ncbi:phosphopantetheine-binding protein [Fulvimonas soli]|jgi:acyl carrier protein|uniref:Acyl carrier protein n=1 Tax=Fulvimonas soli TaxID=155197 RepID=A0A316IBJ5_9GAMM|nr:phosphopantetheine-binding protein [Fulvimonas soli]PWK87725.1 acyl carrier protein [Fulvimonas soli]TNY25056.1 acyl carrier protein [Fulvimonas soli]
MTAREPTALEREIAQLVIDTLNLEDLAAADIPPGQPLFGEGLGLDSVDALELALALQKQYGIRIESDAKDARSHFASVASLAAFVEAQRDACAN